MEDLKVKVYGVGGVGFYHIAGAYTFYAEAYLHFGEDDPNFVEKSKEVRIIISHDQYKFLKKQMENSEFKRPGLLLEGELEIKVGEIPFDDSK